MEHTLDYMKKHPWTIVAFVGVLIVLYLFMGSSSSSGQTAVANSGGPDPNAALAAGTQVQLAQLQYGAQSQGIAAQLSASENQTAAAVTVAGLNASVQQYGIQQSAAVQAATLSTQEVVAGFQKDVAIHNIDASVAINAVQSATYSQLAALQASTTQASYQAQTAQLEAFVNKDVQIAQINAKTQQKKSSNNLIGSIIGGALAIFSDGRLKENISTIGFDARGRRWVKYNYLWDDPTCVHKGLIAQEILQTDPQAVSIGPYGYLMIDYGKLQWN